MTDGFSADDRKKVTFGTFLTIIGGIFLASFKAMGFVLRAVFGGVNYGLFAIAQNLTEMLAYFLVGGFNDAIVYLGAKNIEGREAAQKGSGAAPTIADEDGLYRTLATCIGVPLAFSVAIVVLVQLGLPVLYDTWWSSHDPLLLELVRVLICALPFLLLCQLPTEALKIFLDFRWQVGVVQVFVPTAAVIYGLSFYFVADMGVSSLSWAMLAATMTGTPIAIFGYSRHFSVGRTIAHFFRFQFDREVLNFAIPQSLNMMLNLGMVRLDSLMLSGFVSANAVGIYSLVSDLTQLIRLAKMAFSSVFSPLVARYQAQQNREGIRDALHSLVRFTSALSIPLLIVMMVMYPHFVLSGDETWDYDRWFPWLLCVGPMMSCFFGLAGNLLLMTGHARLLLFNSAVCGVLNFGLNFAFIPSMGLFGAALATAIANFTISFMQIMEMRFIEKLTMPFRLYAWIVASAALPVAAAALVFTEAGQRVVAMMPGQTVFAQSAFYTGAAIALYVLLLFLPPGGFHKAPLALVKKLKGAGA